MVRIDWFAQGWRTYSYADIGHTTVALDETLDVLADFNGDSHSFMARDELLKTERTNGCKTVRVIDGVIEKKK